MGSISELSLVLGDKAHSLPTVVKSPCCGLIGSVSSLCQNLHVAHNAVLVEACGLVDQQSTGAVSKSCFVITDVQPVTNV